MMKAGRLVRSAGLLLAIAVCQASSAQAWERRYYGYEGRYSRQSQDARQDQDDDRTRWRENERRGRGGFSGVVEQLIRSCGQRAAELRTWPFDSIAETVRPDETQRSALEALRGSTAAAVSSLTADCPRESSAPLSARLDEVAHSINTAITALDAVRPSLQSFYGGLDDEQKARLLLRGPAPVEAQERSSRRERWRADANGGREPTLHPLGATCEQLAAALRDWPIQRIERDVRLSDSQRVALYQLATASLKAADALACPAETALTPVGRLDTMRARLAAMRGAVSTISHALLQFYEALDQRQKQRFAQM